MKYNFHDYSDFKDKFIQIFGNDIFKKLQNYLNKHIFKPCLSFAGGTWAPEFAKSKKYMFMFLNTNFLDITLMHETIHYIQVVTGKSILKQRSILQLKNDGMFNISEMIPYINSFCHLLDGNFNKQEILSGFDSLLRIKELSVSKNEKITKEEFFKRCMDNQFLKKVRLINSNEDACIVYVLTCIYFNKHVSIIKQHLINYFN